MSKLFHSIGMINSFPGLILAIETNAKTLTQTDFNQGIFRTLQLFQLSVGGKINDNV